MTWTKRERSLLITGIFRMRRRDEDNESLGTSGRKYTRNCSGCHSNPSGSRFACILCRHIVCSDCTEGKCGHCFRGTRFVRLLEDDRACLLCCCSSPTNRVAFPKCGHTCCEACAHQMSMDARDMKVDLACPFCRTEISGCWIELDEKEEDEVLEEKNEEDSMKIFANESDEPEKQAIKKRTWKRPNFSAGDSIASRIQKRRRPDAH